MNENSLRANILARVYIYLQYNITRVRLGIGYTYLYIVGLNELTHYLLTFNVCLLLML